MLTSLRNVIFLSACFLLLIFTSCQGDGLFPAATSVINDNATASTEKLLMEVDLISADNPSRFIVLDSIKNIEVEINNEIWGVFNYYADNQRRFNDLIEQNGFATTPLDFSHNIVLDYLTTAEDYQSAGEFADFITNFLQPGNYFCTITALTVYDSQNQARRIALYEDFILNIGEGEKSVYIGKIEIEL